MTPFNEHALEILKTRAQRILDEPDDDEAQIDFAAHAYALAGVVVLQQGASSFGLIELENGRPELGVVARRWVESSAASFTPHDLYSRLIDSLKSVEHHLGSDSALRGLDLPPVALETGGACGLTGEVVHRFVSSNALRSLRLHDLRRDALPALQNRSEHPDLHLERLRLHWNCGAKELEVCFPGPYSRSSWLVWSAGPALSDGAGFRVLLCPLEVSSVPQFELLDECRRFRAKGPNAVKALPELHSYLDQVLDAANKQKINLVVFPELMICQATREYLAHRLAGSDFREFPSAVVAGSFHRWAGEVEGPESLVYNESVILDRQGVLLTHRKRGKFSFKPGDLPEDPSEDIFFPDRPEIPASVMEIVEAFDHDGRLQLLETSLGRIAVAICTDCIAPDHSSLESVFRQVLPDLLIIVSMSEETEPFERLMGSLAEYGVSTVMVNAHCAANSKKQALLASTSWGLGEPRGWPPVRFRWVAGERHAEARYLKPEDGKKSWRRTSECNHETGARLCEHEGSVLGLLVDLLPHHERNQAENEQEENR